MKRKLSILMLGIAVMLASCSQSEEMPQTGHTDAVTFTASLENGMSLRPAKTRSVTDPTDEAITRAVLEIYDEKNELVGERVEGTVNGDKISFTAILERDKRYTCLFWADAGEGTYDITDLKAIARSTNPSIAYYAQEEITASNVALNVTLTHAVAKVVLQEISTLAKDDQVGISFDMPAYTFNIKDESYNPGEGENISKTIDIAEDDKTGVITSLYVFAPSTGATPVTMTLSYTAAGALGGTLDVPSVPLKRNYRTVLQGAFGGIESTLVYQPFSVSLDKEWEEEGKNFPDGLLVTTEVGQIDVAKIEKAISDDGVLIIRGPVNPADIFTIRDWAINSGELRKIDLGNIPEKVLYGDAFKGVTSLESIVIPTDVTNLVGSCFRGCTNLRSIVLPTGLKSIGSLAFNESGLTGITIPASVEIMYRDVFASCHDLKYIVFEGTLPVERTDDLTEGKLNLATGGIGNGPAPSIFLPNITDTDVAQTYADYFTLNKVYYNFQDSGDGDRTNPANYTAYTEPAQ